MADVPEDDSGAASGFVSATRAVGQVLGVAAVGALIQNRLAAGLGYAGAVRPALWVGVVVLLLAAASSVAVVRRGPT
jgi:energy-converting hydrogenase Eha subunit B